MVHVHTAVQPVHIPINVPAIIPAAAVHLRKTHVRDVRHGEHVTAAQSVLHVMRGTICPTGHVNSVNPDIIAPGITVAKRVHQAMVRPPPAQPNTAIAIPL